MKVKQAFQLPSGLYTKGDLGVEIEVEGRNLPNDLANWRCERDGSLRGESMEYVLSNPMTLAGVSESLVELDKAYRENATNVHESVRAGVHVHVNVQELNTKQLFTFITAYIVMEELLVNFCGEYRVGNLFCLRIKDAEFLLSELERTAEDKQYHRLGSENLRYASMNVNALSRYGSLEFRAMRGTRDLGLIADWATMLLNIRDVSCKWDNPEELFKWCTANGPESFLETFLGDFKEKVCNGVAYEEMLLEGFSRAHPLAMNTDWSAVEKRNIGGLLFPDDVEFPDEPEEDV